MPGIKYYRFCRLTGQELDSAGFAVCSRCLAADERGKKGAVSEYCAPMKKTLKQPTNVDRESDVSVQTPAKKK